MREVLARTSVVKDLLTLMTGSDSVEVQGNSAAALGNLASSGKPFFFLLLVFNFFFFFQLPSASSLCQCGPMHTRTC